LIILHLFAAAGTE